MAYPIATRGGRGSGNSSPYVPALGDLVLSGALVAGVASSGTILNATAGSTIASTVSGLTVNSAARTYTYNGSGAAGSTNNGLTETLAGATFSPRGNVVTIVSSAVPAFTSNPSISPQGGNVGGTFSGIDGAMSNGGSILSRRWLLNGTSIGSGTTVVPSDAGSLVFENTGTGNVVATSTAVTVAAVSPTLALSPTSPSVASNAAAGTLVSNISNVPAGATPTVTPNDGRLVIAGDASAGWRVVVGMSALSAGTINFAVAATGATGASGVLTVAAGFTTFTYTVQPGMFTAQQTDFPTVVQLAQMPDSFWSAVRSDPGHQGGNIRVYSDAAKTQRLAVDLWAVDPATKKGTVYFKAPAITDGSTFYIECGDKALTQPAVAALYGRNAVWSSYWGVWSFGRSFRNRAGNGEGVTYGATGGLVIDAARDRVITNFQGIVYNPDRDEWLSVATGSCSRVKWNESTLTFDVLQTVTANTVLTGADHLGGCEYYNGKYMLSAGADGYGTVNLVALSATDLSVLARTNIGTGSETRANNGGVDFGAAGICRDPRTGNFYGCHFTESTYLDEWSFSDTTNQFSYVGKIPFTYYGSVPNPAVTTSTGYQGLTYFKGQILISDNTGLSIRAFTVDPVSKTAVGAEKVAAYSTAQEAEDLCVVGDSLVWLVRDSSQTTRLHYYTARDYAKSGTGGVWLPGTTGANSPRVQVDNIPVMPSFTIGGTFAINNAASANARGLLSYVEAIAEGGGAPPRASIILKANGNIQEFDTFTNTATTNASPTPPTNGTGAAQPLAANLQRAHVAYDSATLKKRIVTDQFTSGEVAAASIGAAQLTRLLVGPVDLNGSGGGSTHAAFVYISPQVFSDAYLLTQNRMTANPSAFGVIS